MCTIVILRRPGEEWPLILAANRDEMSTRPWSPPGRHWGDRSHVVAGIDHLAGGSWLGMNDDGVVAAILNRRDTLGPMEGKRSRGELVLEALDHADADAAAKALAAIDPQAYRTFNLIVADNENAFWVRHGDIRGEGEGEGEPGGTQISVEEIPPGLSMFTARERNDLASPRIATYLPLFAASKVPEPSHEEGGGDWTAWETLMAGPAIPSRASAESAMTFALESGFGTISSSLIALESPMTLATRGGERPPHDPFVAPRVGLWRFAEGPPDTAPYEMIEL